MTNTITCKIYNTVSVFRELKPNSMIDFVNMVLLLYILLRIIYCVWQKALFL